MPELSRIEQDMAAAYAEVHSKRVRAELRKSDVKAALEEAQGVVAALERLWEAVRVPTGTPGPPA